MPLPRKLFSVMDVPVMTALFREADLKFVDIGGRGQAFYPLLTLAPFGHYFVSEPDAPEAEALAERLPREAPWRAVTVIPEAIASRHGTADLHITAQPGMSSLLEPDPAVTKRFVLASKFVVTSHSTVPVCPLDDAAARYGFADAVFLKADTQGTELDILQSGPKLLDALVGVHTEAMFHPFYAGQPLFADIDSHLRSRGFALFSLSRTGLRRAGYRKDSYSKHVTTWAHCLYLREPETLLSAGIDPPRRLAALLAVALAFQHFDLAAEIVALIGQAQVLTGPDHAALHDEVTRAADNSTRYIIGKANEPAAESLAESLLASSLRDRHRLE
jgi:FkbM family methyltransferase